MKIAAKKNRVVRIPDEKANEYAKLGYTVTSQDGTVVKQPEFLTLPDAKAEINRLYAQNAEQTQKIAELEQKLNQSVVSMTAHEEPATADKQETAGNQTSAAGSAALVTKRKSKPSKEVPAGA